MADSNDTRLDTWKQMWDTDDIGFHKSEVHKMLQKHISVLTKEGVAKKVFVPLCGKTLDMEWLSGQGLKVVGVDGVKKALEDFFEERNLEWTEEDVPTMGPGCKLLQDKEGKYKLYFGDILLFNKSVEGQLDCVWDRGSLVALNREDVKKYSEVIREILLPNGKVLVETFEYDKATYEDKPRPPPPHAVFEDEMKSLYEPECSVETLDRDNRLLSGAEASVVYYIISKK